MKLQTILLSCLLFCLLLSQSVMNLYAEERPNIVFFIADDISQDDFGCYGHPTIKTPNTDALAKAGMRFDNAYLTISSCSPSRCSIMTGRYPHNTGAPELHVPLPRHQIRFTELLRQAGYYAVLSGKNHMFGRKDRAFDKIVKGGGPSNSQNWVQLVQERPKDKPFFFWFAASDAHREWQINDKAPTYSNDQIIVPPYMIDSERTREDLASYYHEVSRYDYYIGKVTEELRKQGVLDNTMIVIASDNGLPFPRGKSHLYDSGIKTPWVVHFPKAIKGGAVTKSLISSIDLSATCLELAGIEKPEVIQGQSFVPILKDPKVTVREVVFAERNWHVYSTHQRMVRFGDYLYIKNNMPGQRNLVLESHNWPAGVDLWEAHAAGKTNENQQQIFAYPSPKEELFHVKKDPHQLNNLVKDQAHADSLAAARELLATWSTQTADTMPLPDKITPHRYPQPTIENGKILNSGPRKGPKRKEGEMPGESSKAHLVNHPGPIKLPTLRK